MSSRRSTRYEIIITRNDGSSEMIECNARRKGALKRASFVANDTFGWPSIAHVIVRDVMRYEHIFCAPRD